MTNEFLDSLLGADTVADRRRGLVLGLTSAVIALLYSDMCPKDEDRCFYRVAACVLHLLFQDIRQKTHMLVECAHAMDVLHNMVLQQDMFQVAWAFVSEEAFEKSLSIIKDYMSQVRYRSSNIANAKTHFEFRKALNREYAKGRTVTTARSAISSQKRPCSARPIFLCDSLWYVRACVSCDIVLLVACRVDSTVSDTCNLCLLFNLGRKALVPST